MAGNKEHRSRKKPSARMSIEDRRIDWIGSLAELKAGNQLSVGIGDDAAVWQPRQGYKTVLTVDVQSEGTHFMPGWLAPAEVGRRAVSSSISDLAAMNARPAVILVSILIESTRTETFFRKLYGGITAACKDYKVRIAGGNISRGPLSVTVTSIGEAQQKDITKRNRLVNGDELWVTGSPGLARLGLLQLRDRIFGRSTSPGIRRALDSFKNPRARVAEAAALGRTWKPRAVIDLSDGLCRDLHHLQEGPQAARGNPPAGIIIEEEALDGLEPLGELCRKAGLSPAGMALAGGEDYELMLAIPPQTATAARVRAFKTRFGVPLTRIGKVTAEKPGLWLKNGLEGTLTRLEGNSFDHF